MKQLLIFSGILLIFSNAFAQKSLPSPPVLPRNPDDNKVYYKEISQTDGVERAELMKRAMNWVHHYYKNPTGIINLSDSINGVIILKPQFVTYRVKDDIKVQASMIRYTLTLGFKDGGKYRYEIKDINLKADSYFPLEKLFDENDPNVADHYNTLSEADRTFQELIKGLKKGMDMPSEKIKKDEW
ncbi:MAG: DUF4468 domain-containing protein [Chitinophagales bacterium]|nr:DUF4468 domain-containing protein [Chitinophagales bacterium]